MKDFDIEPDGHHQPELAQAIFFGDLGYDWNYELLNQTYRTLLANKDCEFLALGMTRHWKDEEGPRLDVAPFVKGLEYASDRKDHILGKPSKLLFEQACQRLGVEEGRTLMVGDDIHTDVWKAQQAALKGALVRTGKFRDKDLIEGVKPDLELDSFADLPN